MSTEATSSAIKAVLRCSKCGAALPDEALFCLKCGNPVSVPPKQTVFARKPAPKIVEPRRRPRIFLWFLLAVFFSLVGWVALGNDPFAQGLQEMVGWKHDQPILGTPFLVPAHNFRYYKFSLPEGSVNVSIVGEFVATSAEKVVLPDKAGRPDNDIEVYVLSEPAFTVWQNGYATSSVYESGRVAQGEMKAEIPPGAGIYYMVFSNKFSAKSAKNINATASLRYKSWVPDSFRLMKARLWNWLGL